MSTKKVGIADYEKKNKILVFGYIRSQSNEFKIIIPFDINNLCLKFYHLIFEILTFSSKFKSKDGLILSDDNKCVSSTTSFHCYILTTSDPVFHGVHCWRVHV